MIICSSCKHYRHAANRCKKRYVPKLPGESCRAYEEVKIKWVDLRAIGSKSKSGRLTKEFK